MANTPRGYPYSALTDAPAGPTQVQALAQAIDSDVQTVADQRTPLAICRVRKDSDVVSHVAGDGSELAIAVYNQGVTFQEDPRNLVSYATGQFLLKAQGLWGWSISFNWPAVPSGTDQHRRSVYILQNGSEPIGKDGRVDVPFAGGAWGPFSHQAQGSVYAAANDTIQAAVSQNSGAAMDSPSAVFTVWLKALSS